MTMQGFWFDPHSAGVPVI